MKVCSSGMIGSCLVLALVASVGAMAADEPMVCAVNQTNACAKGGQCTQGTASDVNLPVLLKIAPTDREISSVAEDGQRRVSAIKHSAKDTESRFVVYQGVEQGGAWSVVVDTTSGAMTIALATGDTDAYVLYGTCSRSLLKGK